MKKYYWIFAVGLIYLYLSVTAPISSSSQTFNLTVLQVRLLQLTIAIPFIVSWVAGVVGHSEIRRYSHHLKDEYEQQSFKNISLGILILVASSLISAFTSSFKNRLAASSDLYTPVLTIITNYAYVLLPLASIILIFIAGKSLARSVKAPRLPVPQVGFSLIFPLSFSALNVYLTLTNPSTQASYYLSNFMIVLTILIPSIITWFLGTLALLHIQSYSQHIKGTVYQAAISLLSSGLFFVVVSSIFLQLLLALGSIRLLSLGINIILGLIYIFIILQTLGYILVARASIRFSKVDKILSQYIKQAEDEIKK